MKKLALALLISTTAMADTPPETYNTIKYVKTNPHSVSIRAKKFTQDHFIESTRPYINLIGEGIIGYEGEKTYVDIKAVLLNRNDYINVEEREGSSKATDFILETLDERVLPIFTDMATKIRAENDKKRQKYLKTIGNYLGTDNFNYKAWIMPTGYPFAEEVKIDIPVDTPSRIVFIYKQNYRGKMFMRGQVVRFGTKYK